MRSDGRTFAVLSAGVLILPLLFSGCAQQYANPEQAAQNACSAFGPRVGSGALIGGLGGAAAGAAVGGLAGHSGGAALIGAAAGGLLGAIAGGITGHELDQRDCAAAHVALQQIGTAQIGQSVAWADPATGSHGEYIPESSTFTDPKTELVCRPVRADYYMHGHQPVEGETGNVCRDANGNWHWQEAST